MVSTNIISNNGKEEKTQKIIFKLIAELTGQENIVAVPREFIKFTGDPATGIFLAQLIYWCDRGSRKDGFIYKSHKEWEEEIGLERYYCKKARKKLEDMGILETKLKKANGAPTLHYRLKMDKFVDKFINHLKSGYDAQNDRNEQIAPMDCINSPNGMSKYPQSLTEITTEITTENTKKKRVGSQKSASHYFFYDSEIQNLLDSKKDYLKKQIIYNVDYFLQKYQEVTGQEHPKLTVANWQKVFDNITYVESTKYGRGFTIDEGSIETIVDRYFNKEYLKDSERTCNYRIMHFISNGIMKNIIYEEPELHFC